MYTGVSSPQIAQLLSFFMGVILGSLGLLQLGFLVNFISSSVVTGFIQAASFTIPLGQLKKIFGVKSSRPGFIGKIADICEEVFAGNSNYYDLGVGLGSIAMLIGLKELKGRSANWKYLQQDKVPSKYCNFFMKNNTFLDCSENSFKINLVSWHCKSCYCHNRNDGRCRVH